MVWLKRLVLLQAQKTDYIISLVNSVLRGHPFCTVKVAFQHRWPFMGGLDIWMVGNEKSPHIVIYIL